MGVFQSVFPVKDYNDTSILEFVSYELDKPKYNVEECQQRDMTYGAPLKVKLRLVVFDIDEETDYLCLVIVCSVPTYATVRQI